MVWPFEQSKRPIYRYEAAKKALLRENIIAPKDGVKKPKKGGNTFFFTPGKEMGVRNETAKACITH